MSDKADAFWLLLIAGALGLFAVNKCTGPSKPEQAAEAPPPPLMGPLPSDYPTRPTGAVYLFDSGEGSSWFFDADTMKGDRKHRTGWFTMDHSKNKKTTLRTTRALYSVDCDTMGALSLAWIDYGKDGSGNRVEADKPGDPPTFYPPESNAGIAIAELCAAKYGP